MCEHFIELPPDMLSTSNFCCERNLPSLWLGPKTILKSPTFPVFLLYWVILMGCHLGSLKPLAKPWLPLDISFSVSLDSLDERRHQLKFIFKTNNWVFGAAFDLQENEMWSLWQYSWGIQVYFQIYLDSKYPKVWNFCLWLLTTVYKTGNLGKQQALFDLFSMCSEKWTGLIFNTY